MISIPDSKELSLATLISVGWFLMKVALEVAPILLDLLAEAWLMPRSAMKLGGGPKRVV